MYLPFIYPNRFIFFVDRALHHWTAQRIRAQVHIKIHAADLQPILQPGVRAVEQPAACHVHIGLGIAPGKAWDEGMRKNYVWQNHSEKSQAENFRHTTI